MVLYRQFNKSEVVEVQSVTKVYYVRHAEPNYDNHNDALRELTLKGLDDRKLVTKFLADKEINVAVSSPFRRAVDTIKEFADLKGIKIEVIDEFRERKVDSGWIDDFTSFTQNQWDDFNYKLSDGECLQEVQKRNISALLKLIDDYKGKNIVIGGHGTALSTIINYFDTSFGYDEFAKMKNKMPWIVEFQFDSEAHCCAIYKHDLF